ESTRLVSPGPRAESHRRRPDWPYRTESYGRVPGGTVRRSKHLDGRNRHDELAAPFTDVLSLGRDLAPQVPGQDQDVVRTCGADLRRIEDGDVRSGRVATLFQRACVHGVVQEVGADAAIIQERVALAGGAVARNRLARALRPNEKLEQVALRLQHARL